MDAKKIKQQPQFWVDGRRARTLRRHLGMPVDMKDLNETTTSGVLSLPLDLVQESLDLPDLTFRHWANEEAFLCGGALTAWIGQYPTSDYDFFFPGLEAAQRFHERVLGYGFQMDGFQGSEAGQDIYNQIQQGELRIDELVRDVIENEEIRALNYSRKVDENFYLAQIVLIIQGASVAEVIDTFDFTVSMLGTDGETLYFGPYTWTDLFRRRLRVHNIHHGISTMRRMVKYAGRGFYACVGTMREIAQGVIDSPSDQSISLD